MRAGVRFAKQDCHASDTARRWQTNSALRRRGLRRALAAMETRATTLVVFDLDGTLIDSFADIAAAINAALALRGLPRHSVAAVKAMVGDGVGKLAERAAPGLAAEEHRAIAAAMIDYYRVHPADHAKLYPGIEAVLEAIAAAGHPMAILSNKPHDLTVACCRELRLDARMVAIQGDDPPHVPRKPDATGLRLLMAFSNTTSCVIVGDGLPDGQLAASVGAPFVAVGWGTRSREELERLGPAAFVESTAALADAILRVAQA